MAHIRIAEAIMLFSENKLEFVEEEVEPGRGLIE
jgi:hypothetical protein